MKTGIGKGVLDFFLKEKKNHIDHVENVGEDEKCDFLTAVNLSMCCAVTPVAIYSCAR